MYTYYHYTLQLGTFMIYFSLFHIEIEVTVVELFRGGGGGATGMSPPPTSKITGGGLALPPPSSYAYAIFTFLVVVMMLHYIFSLSRFFTSKDNKELVLKSQIVNKPRPR